MRCVNIEMKLMLTVSLLILSLHLCGCNGFGKSSDLRNLSSDPDAKRNVTQLITSKGYPVKDYTVQTEDGYLLSVQRIPHGRGKSGVHAQNKPVVFLQHGLLSSTADWVMNFPDQSLGFILADAGYDVFLGNIRGNTYSRRHVKLTPKMKEFWEFSFDEMGKYDLPAMIDFALNVTGQQQLYYIGHSQGTTSMFAGLSENPELNQKIKLFIALAPVTTLGHITTGIRYLAPFASDLEFLLDLLGCYEFLPSDTIMKYLSELLCDTKLKFICEDAIFLICGTDYSQLNKTRLDVYVSHSPAGASTQCVVHYAQLVNSKNFQKYDFGKHGNMKHYNQSTPPVYHVENVTAPVVLVWSQNDELADPTDVGLLHERLKTLVDSYRVELDAFNHLDFVWAVDAKKLVYDYVLSALVKYAALS